MGTILDQICSDKKKYINHCKLTYPLEKNESQAKSASPPRGFFRSLRDQVKNGNYGLITEIKRASPSKGIIREDFDPEKFAIAYRKGGATCLSVLTDQPYFLGDDSYLQIAHNAVSLPILRKDFFLDTYQVTEARALGADCILLIMAALDDGQAYELEACALDWGMDVLVEVHDLKELERALKLNSPLLGINNRNLKTLKVDMAVTKMLLPFVPEDRLVVSESGISSASDLAELYELGAKCFLVGESLMCQKDLTIATENLLAIDEMDQG